MTARRSITALVGLALLGAVVVSGPAGPAGPAGAGTAPPPPAVDCVFSAVVESGALVVNGVTAAGTEVVVFADGVEVARTTADASGVFTVTISPAPAGTISVGPTRGYPLTTCPQLPPAEVVRIIGALGPISQEGGGAGGANLRLLGPLAPEGAGKKRNKSTEGRGKGGGKGGAGGGGAGGNGGENGGGNGGGTDFGDVFPWLLLLLVVGGFLFLIAWRRRRRAEEEPT